MSVILYPMNTFRVNLSVDWQNRKVCLQDLNEIALQWTLSLPNSITVKGDNMAITITDLQKFTASIQPISAKGNPAPVDGIPVWDVSDSALLSVQPALDGLSAVVLAVGPTGTGQLTVSADADLGAGVVTLNGVLDVTVIGSQAVALNIVTSVPEPQ